MEKFTKLGLSKELTDVLKEFGFTEPSEIQEKAIPVAMAGKDIIGGSATGSGKTLAFSSAIIEKLKPNRNVQALILTPTRELAEQVATSISNFGENKSLNVLAVYGGVRIDTQIRKLHSTDVLVGTPGRILDHLKRRSLNLKSIKFLVLDEVDRMFDMGFSKDVEKIINECPKDRQTMLFSATVSSSIDYLAKKYTKNAVEISVKSFVDPSKLTQVYYDVPDNKKFALLVHLLKKENANLVMVFCNTRRNVDFIANNLIENGIHAKAIHGGLEQKKRIRVLDEFHSQGLGVLVCTDVAARGLDIKSVTHVYNYDVPKDSKDYIHRIGRTARAGKDGKAIIILGSKDYDNFRNLLQTKENHITREEVPQLGYVKMNLPQKRGRFGNSRRNDETRGRFGNRRHDDRQKNSGRDNYKGSSRRDSGHQYSDRDRRDRQDRNRPGKRNFSKRPQRGRHQNKRENNFRHFGGGHRRH